MTAAPAAAAGVAAAAAAGAGVAPTAAAAPAQAAYDFASYIPGFLYWVDFCNNGAAAAAAGEFLGLTVDGKTVGYLKPRWVLQPALPCAG